MGGGDEIGVGLDVLDRLLCRQRKGPQRYNQWVSYRGVRGSQLKKKQGRWLSLRNAGGVQQSDRKAMSIGIGHGRSEAGEQRYTQTHCPADT